MDGIVLFCEANELDLLQPVVDQTHSAKTLFTTVFVFYYDKTSKLHLNAI